MNRFFHRQQDNDNTLTASDCSEKSRAEGSRNGSAPGRGVAAEHATLPELLRREGYTQCTDNGEYGRKVLFSLSKENCIFRCFLALLSNLFQARCSSAHLEAQCGKTLFGMTVTGTHIAYLHLCHRKLWLFANGINMEHTSDIVSEGKLIGETSYEGRATKFTEIQLDGIRIDFYDAKNKMIHEVKKSSKMEKAHVAQVKYYIFKLAQNGITGVRGIIDYPKLRQREEVVLSEHEIPAISTWEAEVKQVIEQAGCPALLNSRLCKNCSYFDFCYSSE